MVTKATLAQNVESTANRTSGGLEAGGSSTGIGNTFYGYRAGKLTNSTGTNNTFVGRSSGSLNTSGIGNIFLGANAGFSNTTGSYNILVGYMTGESANGSGNVFIGSLAGLENTGNNNLFLGNGAGQEAVGSNNVFIGRNAGFSDSGSNLLYIDNQENYLPLILGDFASDLVKLNAKVGIGGVTTFPTASGGVNVSNYKLFVKGGILADEVRVSTTWADYVFAEDYALPTLEQVENHIKQNGHLIGVPSAKEVEADGIEVGQMARIQQEKIEELTLYIIEQHKVNEKQSQEIAELKAMVAQLLAKK